MPVVVGARSTTTPGHACRWTRCPGNVLRVSLIERESA
jgi:hypothetical protein